MIHARSDVFQATGQGLLLQFSSAGHKPQFYHDPFSRTEGVRVDSAVGMNPAPFETRRVN